MDHLEELRSRLFKIVVAFVLGSVIAWFLYNPILAVLTKPLKGLPGAGEVISRGKLVVLAPTEAFFIRVKITAFAGFVVALPVILWQLWRFVTPGLHRKEKRYAIPFVFVSLALFAAGIWLALFSLPKALQLLTSFGGKDIVLVPRASEYLSFMMLMIAAFGISFEFPIVLIGLVMAGVLTAKSLRKGRQTAWIIILIVSAVITPTTDPITMLLMAVPMLFLYEATILTARLMKK